MKNCYSYFLFFLFQSAFFESTAQMKSCCDPEGVTIISTVTQSAGTLKMVKILDSIGKHANPEDFYLMNTARAELFKKKLETEKDPYKRLDNYFQYSSESLNAGNTNEAIAVLSQIINSMKITGENLTAEYKMFFDLLAIAYMRKGELDNCAANHTAQSCIIPIQGGGLHQLKTGSESAIQVYQMILNKFPEDLQ